MIKKLKNLLKPKLNLLKGTRFVSFLFIGASILIAAGVLFAANTYYNIDTGEVITEEIKRITKVLRATGGVIVGGSATQNPSSGYVFEVVGGTKLGTTTVAGGALELTAANQTLRFTGGTNFYVGFQATTSMSSNRIYILPDHDNNPPNTDYVLTWQPGNQLEWKPATSTAGVGDITAVGDVTQGAAFTGADTGNTLWFEGATADSFEIALTGADPTADATITLPALTGTVALQNPGSLGAGSALFASSSGLIATSSNFQWNDASRFLQLGSSGNDAQLRIYSSNLSGYYVGFAATSSMTQTTTYYFPVNYGSNNQVLTTDGAGNLVWKDVTGAGAVDTSGTPAAGQVAFFVDSNTIEGDTGFTFASTTDALTISGSVISAIFTSNSTTTINSGTGYPIVLDPDSGKIVLGSGDYIQTASGYEIGKSGTEILREMIPILGFDLPVQTATTSYVKISRTMENYPFSPAATGTTRVHRFVIRYTDALPLASTSYWRVATTSGAAWSTFTLPGSNNASTSLNAGQATTTSDVSIPTDGTDWWLEVKSQGPYPNHPIKIFQIFLAAYDKIQ